MKIKTLEHFLEYCCGMAPSMLVEHYEEHREWVENTLGSLNTQNFEGEEDTYEDAVEAMWLCLPEPPNNFFIE